MAYWYKMDAEGEEDLMAWSKLRELNAFGELEV